MDIWRRERCITIFFLSDQAFFKSRKVPQLMVPLVEGLQYLQSIFTISLFGKVVDIDVCKYSGDVDLRNRTLFIFGELFKRKCT